MFKKAKQFVSFKFGDVQLLDIMNILGGATSLNSFHKAYKTAETEGFFPYEWFDCPQKMNNSELPPYDAFFSKLRNVNPLEKDYSDYQKLLSSGLKTEEALSKMRFSKPPPSGEENYQYSLDIWNHESMCTFKYFLRWYNNKDVVPTLEGLQKTLAFYHKKGTEFLKHGCIFRIRRIFVSTYLPVPNSVPLLQPLKTCCKRSEKIWLVDLLSFSHVKL